MSVNDDRFDFKLVQLVEQNTHLYNKESTDFKDIRKRYKSWEEIGNALGTSGEYCERRWNVLRTRFAKEKRTEKEKQAIGVETNWSVQWPLYKHMSFLSRHVKSRNTYKGLNISTSPVNAVDVKIGNSPNEDLHNENSNTDTQDYRICNEIEESLKLKTEQIDEADIYQPLINDEDDSMDYDSIQKHKKRKNEYQEISKCLISNVKFISDYFRKKMNEQKDSDCAFANMICAQLKEIESIEKKNIIKAKIMQCFITD